MNIAYYVGSMGPAAWYRAHVPGTALERRGHEVMLTDDLRPVHVLECDVLVLQQLHSEGALNALRDANAQGKLTVFDATENLWALDPAHPEWSTLQTPERRDRLEAIVREAKVVTVPNVALASVLKQRNPNVRVLPHMLPDENWPPPRAAVDDGFVNIGWAAVTDALDLRLLDGVLQQVLDRHPRTRFLYTSVGIPFGHHDRMIELEPTSMEDFGRLLRQFDIGLAPVADTRSNATKSDLKFLEYAGAGVPCVASPVGALGKSIVPGRTGLLAKNAKDWLKLLDRLVEQPEFRTELGAAARRYAEDRMMAANVWRWEKAYGIEGS